MPPIAAASVLTADGLLRDTEVVVERGLITAIRPVRSGPVADGLLVPGFVDLQVNGVGDVDVAAAEGDDWARLDAALLAQGVTTWCPTLVTAPLPAYDEPLRRIEAAKLRGGPGPAIAGAHLEGPFLGGAPGAHPRRLLLDPDAGWLAGLPPIVRLVTLAPERHGALDAVAALARAGVVVSLGHSTATYDTALAAVEAGARLVTHLFNGMAPLHHRAPGLVGVALSDERVVASLIADLVHVHPAVLRAVFRAKPGRVALVTDSVAWQAQRVGRVEIRLRDGAPRLEDGTLAGSALTADAAVRNVVGAGIPVADAVRAVSETPAEVLGLDDRGRIEVGRRGDLVLLDEDLGVRRVWVGGEPVRG